MALPLAGKVAVVTGSSRNIGAAIAKRLATDGAHVVVNYVGNAAAAQEVVDTINKEGRGKAVAIKGDMSKIADGQRLIDDSIAAFGKLDILCLNAGLMNNATLENLTEKAFDDHYNINVKVPLFMVKAAAPYLKAGGRVFFFSSSTARFSGITPNYLLYTSTKGAVEQMNRILAKDLGAKGITVNCIGPGPVNTELFTNGKTEQQIQFFANLHPMKRIPQPEEIAPLVAFLSREEAGWINGQTILCNGGLVV